VGLIQRDPAEFASPRTGHDGFYVWVRHPEKAVLQCQCECGWEGTETRSRTALLDEHAMHQRRPGPPPAPAVVDCNPHPPSPVTDAQLSLL
jgi:hypothetical protein